MGVVRNGFLVRHYEKGVVVVVVSGNDKYVVMVVVEVVIGNSK